MIDGLGVVANGLWVLGLAGMLAALSYFDYHAKTHSLPARLVLNSPSFVRSFSWAAIVFCIGVAASGGSWWQRVAWAVLAVWFAVQAWKSREPVDPGQVQ